MLDFRAILPLTAASLKMYFRDTSAIFFTFIFPIIFLVVFGFINSNETITLEVAYIKDSKGEYAAQFDEEFMKLVRSDDQEDSENKIFKIKEDINTIDEAREAVEGGDLTAAIWLPESFELTGEIAVLVDESNPAFGEVANNAVSSILQQFNRQINIDTLGREPLAPFKTISTSVQSDELNSIDYLVPGIIAFSIMSMGIFSITEGFIQLKTDGSLRRLKVAPINAGSFLVAQSLTRLVMTLINVLTMLLVAIFMFDFSLRGDIFSFLLVSILGIGMFLGLGYAIAGWARDGNQAAPLSNIVFFPMMFLSGTFFPRESFPDWLVPVTDYMPLTYVAEAMRKIANTSGLNILDLGPEILGITVWTVVIYFIATRVFRWE